MRFRARALVFERGTRLEQPVRWRGIDDIDDIDDIDEAAPDATITGCR